MKVRPAHLAALAALALAAPAALAQSPPPPGDQSPSYGGGSTGPDTTAPYLRASIRTRHLATLARTGKLQLSVAASEPAVVRLRGTLTGHRGGASVRVTFRGATVLFRRAGQAGATLTLKASSRHALARFLRAAGRGARGTVRVTGVGADDAHNKRHLTKTAVLKR